MAKQENFGELVGAIQESFLQCNQLAERQHIEMLSKYFDSDNRPVVIPVSIPQFDDSGDITYKDVEIPKLCLVPISSLKLDGIKVNFKVRLAGKVMLEEKAEQTQEELCGEIPEELQGRKGRPILGYLQGGGIKREPNSFADVTLQFSSQNPPEGIMRLQDELVRVTL